MKYKKLQFVNCNQIKYEGCICVGGQKKNEINISQRFASNPDGYYIAYIREYKHF